MASEDSVKVLVISIVLAAAIMGGLYAASTVQADDPIQDRHMMKRGEKLPVLWIFLDDSEVNSRHWTGFEERSSRVINIPFLNLCYESCVKANGLDYRIDVIGGLADLAARMGGWEALPTHLRNSKAVIGEPEMNWIRAAVLKCWGGLWVSPATLWLRPMGALPKKHIVLFGSDDEVTFVGDGGTDVPSLRVAWSPIPEHPVWCAWEKRARDRLEKRAGGGDFRRDDMSDAADAIRQAEKMGEPIEVRPMAELTRKGAAGRRIQIEDLLAAGQEGYLPFTVTDQTIYVPIPWPELKERRAFGWFLRMSEEQVMNSDLAISWLFKRTGMS